MNTTIDAEKAELQFKRDEIMKEYESNKFKYKELETEIKYILDRKLEERDIKIHSILSRIKKFNSFFDKLERKNAEDPFSDITDIVGTRVVCLFKSDINKIGDCIRECFDVKSEDNKIDGDNENVASFGYMSFHFIAQLKDQYTGPRYDHLKGLKFEIQVRTISMDAWANISHYLDYKSENDIPEKLEKDFHALSGLFYIADTHFEMFVESSHKSQAVKEKEVEKMLSTGENDLADEKLDLDTLRSYLKQKFKGRLVADTTLESNESKAVSKLLSELLNGGYDTLTKLDDAMNKSHEAFVAYETKYAKPGHYRGVGVVRVSLYILDEAVREASTFTKYNKTRYTDPEIQSLIKS